MSEWKPIETAPKDVVVLTECGTAICPDGWGTPDRWFLCYTDKCVPHCNTYGPDIAEMKPTRWMPLPTPPQYGDNQ